MASEIIYVDLSVSGEKIGVTTFIVNYDGYNEKIEKCKTLSKELKKIIRTNPTLELELAKNKITQI